MFMFYIGHGKARGVKSYMSSPMKVGRLGRLFFYSEIFPKISDSICTTDICIVLLEVTCSGFDSKDATAGSWNDKFTFTHCAHVIPCVGLAVWCRTQGELPSFLGRHQKHASFCIVWKFIPQEARYGPEANLQVACNSPPSPFTVFHSFFHYSTE